MFAINIRTYKDSRYHAQLSCTSSVLLAHTSYQHPTERLSDVRPSRSTLSGTLSIRRLTITFLSLLGAPPSLMPSRRRVLKACLCLNNVEPRKRLVPFNGRTFRINPTNVIFFMQYNVYDKRAEQIAGG